MNLSIGGRILGASETLGAREATAGRALMDQGAADVGQKGGLTGLANGLGGVSRGAVTGDRSSAMVRGSGLGTQDQDAGAQGLSQISQWLQSLVALLQQLKDKIGGSGSGDSAGQGNACGQGNDAQSGSGGILGQLQALLQKLVGGQSTDAADGNNNAAQQSQTPGNTAGADNAGTGDAGNDTGGNSLTDLLNKLVALLKKLTGQSDDAASSTPASGGDSGTQSPSQQGQDGGGLLAKLSGLLQIIGLGALLSLPASQGDQGK